MMQKRLGFSWIEAVALIGILAILAAILFPVFSRRHPPSYRSNCQANLKQIGLGIKQYQQDYNEKYPIIATDNSAFGWADAIQPYLKSTQVYQCDAEKSAYDGSPDPRHIGYTDYWFNSRLAEVKEEKLAFSFQTLLLGEGNDGKDATDARYAISSFPPAWLNNQKSPLYRHLDGANFAFADGHVKWLKAESLGRVVKAKVSERDYSFAVD